MHYDEALAYLEGNNICPFCHEKHPKMVYENEHLFVIPARAPYVQDHLLIIPKRHVVLLRDMTHTELQSLHELVDFWTAKLHVRHETVNLLLRDGLVHGVSGKSVNHLHFHLIPDCPIGSKEGTDGPDREFMDDAEYQKFTDAIRELYL